MPTKNDTKMKILPKCQKGFDTKTNYLRLMKNSSVIFLFTLFIAIFSVSCEKEIEIDFKRKKSPFLMTFLFAPLIGRMLQPKLKEILL